MERHREQVSDLDLRLTSPGPIMLRFVTKPSRRCARGYHTFYLYNKTLLPYHPYDGRIRPSKYGSIRVTYTCQPVTAPQWSRTCRYGDRYRITGTVQTVCTGYGGQPYPAHSTPQLLSPLYPTTEKILQTTSTNITSPCSRWPLN
jgi:hypothetical protein